MKTQPLLRVRSLFSCTHSTFVSQNVNQSVASGFALRFRTAAVLTLSLIAMAGVPFLMHAQNVARHPKIRGDIHHHEQLKKRPAGRAFGAHRHFVYGRGLNGDDLTGEAVAIYVKERLTRAEIGVLRAQGVEIDPDLWIPPIPGRHALGFHLGVARYASYNDLVRARDNVPAGGTIAIKAGSSSETITITASCILQAYGGPVTIGR